MMTTSFDNGATVELSSQDHKTWTMTIKFEQVTDEMRVAGAIGMFAEKMISERVLRRKEEERSFIEFLKTEGVYDDYIAKFRSQRVQALQG